MFQQPSQGDRVSMEELTGSLALFFVHEVRQGINTTFGEKEAINCDVHVLDGTNAGEIYENALIFQGAVIGSLRSAAGGDPVLARISKGVAKPGQKPPFVLAEFTAEDATRAEAYLTERAKRFQGTGNGSTPAAAAAPEKPAATGSVDIASLPPEVQELLKQAGAVAR